MKYDVAIIGLGPAGIEFAKESIKKGLKVIAFEKSSVGGTCLNLGCIPTKTMLSCSEVFFKFKNHSKYGISPFEDSVKFSYSEMCSIRKKIVDKLSSSLKKDLINKGLTIVSSNVSIKVKNNFATLISDCDEYSADYVVVASGSVPCSLKIDCNENMVIDSNELLNINSLPKSILIVGSGAIGIEWARILNSLGTDVTIVEIAPTLLPQFDIDVSNRIERILKYNKIKFYKSASILHCNGNVATLSNGFEVQCDKILLATGRSPCLPNFTDNFKIDINSNCTTNVSNLYVCGDATGGKMLAHFASFQAKALFAFLFDGKQISIPAIPSVIYGSPEIASIGVNEQDIKNIDDYKIYKMPVSFLPKSWCDGEIEGFIKLIVKNNLIVGAHIVSKEASALISQIAIIMKAGLQIDQINEIIFPHPTFSEGIVEALNYE